MIDVAGLEPGDSCPVCGNLEYPTGDAAICTAKAGNLMCRVCTNTFMYHGDSDE